MSAPIIAFFNNKGGVGETSFAYCLAMMTVLRQTGLSYIRRSPLSVQTDTHLHLRVQEPSYL